MYHAPPHQGASPCVEDGDEVIDCATWTGVACLAVMMKKKSGFFDSRSFFTFIHII